MKYQTIVYDEVQIVLPAIYRWEIFDNEERLLAVYIGKASNPNDGRPVPRYQNNVCNLLTGQKPLNGASFRGIHAALAFATIREYRIHLSYLANSVDLKHSEKEFIERLNTKGNNPWQTNGKGAQAWCDENGIDWDWLRNPDRCA